MCHSCPNGRFRPHQEKPKKVIHFALVVGILSREAIDPDLPTHIIAVGYSHGQGNQFVAAATTRARRFLALTPASSNDDFVRVAADYLYPNGPTAATLAK